MTHSRRTVLRRGIVLGVFGLSGCLEGSTATTTETPQTDEQEMPTEIRPWFEEVSLGESKRESVNPIVFGDLSSSQQEIVRAAMKQGEYATQMGEQSGAFSSVRNEIDARANGDIEVYLKRSETYYRVGLVEGDHIVASP